MPSPWWYNKVFIVHLCLHTPAHTHAHTHTHTHSDMHTYTHVRRLSCPHLACDQHGHGDGRVDVSAAHAPDTPHHRRHTQPERKRDLNHGRLRFPANTRTTPHEREQHRPEKLREQRAPEARGLHVVQTRRHPWCVQTAASTRGHGWVAPLALSLTSHTAGTGNERSQPGMNATGERAGVRGGLYPRRTGVSDTAGRSDTNSEGTLLVYE